MKYKNRLIIPTLVSTSLLASTIVANAEEVEHDEQNSQHNIEEYSNVERTSETDLDFIEANDEDDAEETNEESPEDNDETDEESEKESDEELVETVEELVETVEETEILEEDVESGNTLTEDIDNTVEEETATEEAEETVEAVEEIEEEVSLETPTAENTEEVEEEQVVPAEEAVETPDVEETADVEKQQEVSAEETAETPVVEETAETTYKYDSESLGQELENLSKEERTTFLEENAEDIEADEEMLNELSEVIEKEHDIDLSEDEVFAASASTFSTMSVSQAITDINEYIAANDFEVADIQYDILGHLPLYAYESNYGNNPENGKPGKPSGVVLHDVGNDTSTIHGEISYMSENWDNAFVHAFVDADNIIQVANTDYLAYGAGPVSNEIHLQVELVRHDNQHDFARSINNYADYIANLLYKYKLPAERADYNTGEGTLWSHVEVSHILGGTASPDPYEYFASHGYAYNDVISLIQNRYNNLYDKVTTPHIYMPTFKGETEVLQADITGQNRGLYESITDVKTYDASFLQGMDLRVVRSEIYNFEEYYLLENANDGSTIGWMYAGDVITSALEVKPEIPEVTPEPEAPVETPEPEAPVETPEPEAPVETPEPEAPVETPEPEAPVETPEPEAPVETPEPEVPVETPEPEVPVETPEPEAPVETPKPEAPVETPEPEAPVETPEPEVPVETPEPEAPVETPEPEAPVETPEPEAPVETPEPEAPVETPEPEAPVETPEPETPVETPEPEAPVETPEPEAPVETPEPEAPVETPEPETPVETPEPETPDDDNNETPEVRPEPAVPEDNNDDLDTDDNNQEVNSDSNNNNSEADTEVPADDNTESAAEEVSSSLEDAETGVRVYSATDELEGKSLIVTLLGSSDAINAPHDLFDIHVLNADGSLYSLNNPVTVYLPANGYVSNLYYLGNIGETLEAVNYNTDDGYVVFEAPSFSQYAVVYGNQDEDNTTVPPVSNDKNTGSKDTSDDRANEHPTVYTEDVDDSAAESTELEVLPNTGVAEQSTTIFATILAALGLGFLVRRRKTTEK